MSDEQDRGEWLKADPEKAPKPPFWVKWSDGSPKRYLTIDVRDWAGLCDKASGVRYATHVWVEPVAEPPPLPEPEWSHDAAADLTAGAIFTKHHYPPSQGGFSLQLRDDALLRNVWTDDVHEYLVKALDALAREPELLEKVEVFGAALGELKRQDKVMRARIGEADKALAWSQKEMGRLRQSANEAEADLEEMRGCATPEAGAEAEDLRREIEAMQVYDFSHEYTRTAEVVAQLQGILDRVDTRDSLAHMIRMESEEIGRLKHSLEIADEIVAMHEGREGLRWLKPDADNPPAMSCIVRWGDEESACSYDGNDFTWRNDCDTRNNDSDRITGHLPWPKDAP